MGEGALPRGGGDSCPALVSAPGPLSQRPRDDRDQDPLIPPPGSESHVPGGWKAALPLLTP